MFIGIDDTDSEKGFCTTYLAAVLIERLKPIGELIGLPKLIRLNPCAPFKTRGNAAIGFQIDTDRPEEVKEQALQVLLQFSDLSGKNTNPGLVAAEGISKEMKDFYHRAVTGILEIDDAREILDAQEIWYRGFKNKRGLIGALAAVGAEFEDNTYELIAYRERNRWGTTRQIDPESVWKADRLTYPRTWDTVDYKNKRIVFAPHSADPVLFGIRGDDVEAIETAFKMIESEPYERRLLYITNQGTDAHIISGEIVGARDLQSYRLKGVVNEPPRAIEGGHLFFSLVNGDGRIECAAFEPTKSFREVVRRLVPGDRVEVYGAVKSGTLNLEKLEIIELADRIVSQAPICPGCGRRMKSAGSNQGYRCRTCRLKTDNRHEIAEKREIEKGFYEVPPCARRHLSKQLVRMVGRNVHPSR